MPTTAAAPLPRSPRHGPAARARLARAALAAAAVPAGGYVLAAGPDAPAAARARLRALRPRGDTVSVDVSLAPLARREAVGGWPVPIREGRVVPGLDTVGPAEFRGPRPRSAVALAGADRALLVAGDGRQPGHSTGKTLPQLAALLRDLAATEALNLDGGGSTTLVVRGGAFGSRIVNRPSDPGGERPVGNTLAVVRGRPDRPTESAP